MTAPIARLAAALALVALMAAPLVAQTVPGDTATADSAAVPRARLFPLPFVFYQPETKLGAGGGLMRTYATAPETRSSSANLLLVLTQRRQYSALLQAEHYTPADRERMAGELLWSRFPDLFYGVGNETRKADEEPYTLEHAGVSLDARRRVAGRVYLGLTYHGQRTRAVEVAEGGMLELAQANPDDRAIPGSAGGTLSGGGVVAVYDTRDHALSPRGGELATLSLARYDGALGSDFGYTRAELDYRSYAAPRRGHVVAAQVILTRTWGATPFYEMPMLGGQSTLRGYYEGRYRGRLRELIQLEYRLPVWGRVGAAAFAGGGRVREGRSVLEGMHWAGGAGLRVLLSREERVSLRIDYGIGKGDGGLYFALGEAF